MKSVVLVALSILYLQANYAQDSIQIKIDSIFKTQNVEGCFVLFNEKDSSYLRYNAAYCDTGYLPASTFKIPHSLLVLQEDLVRDTNQVLPWDGKERNYEVWNQDQNLATAFKYSCVWVYVDFTKYISADTYQDYLHKFNYGNEKMQGPAHMFWLAGNMRISANQQIDFITKLYRDELPVDKKHQKLVKELMVLDQNGIRTFSGKTGGAKITDSEYIMWLVGYVETNENTYCYAMNFISNDFDSDKHKRVLITKKVFKYLSIME